MKRLHVPACQRAQDLLTLDLFSLLLTKILCYIKEWISIFDPRTLGTIVALEYYFYFPFFQSTFHIFLHLECFHFVSVLMFEECLKLFFCFQKLSFMLSLTFFRLSSLLIPPVPKIHKNKIILHGMVGSHSPMSFEPMVFAHQQPFLRVLSFFYMFPKRKNCPTSFFINLLPIFSLVSFVILFLCFFENLAISSDHSSLTYFRVYHWFPYRKRVRVIYWISKIAFAHVYLPSKYDLLALFLEITWSHFNTWP